jgi:hypothetical protein
MSAINTITSAFRPRVASASHRTASRVTKGVAVVAAVGAFGFAAPAAWASADATPAGAAAAIVVGPTIITEGSGNVFIGNTIVTAAGTAVVTTATG